MFWIAKRLILGNGMYLVIRYVLVINVFVRYDFVLTKKMITFWVGELTLNGFSGCSVPVIPM